MKSIVFLVTVLLSLGAFGQAGSLDTTFQANYYDSFKSGSGADNSILASLKSTDETFFIGGHFLEYNGVSANHFVNLNADGSIHTEFSIGSGFDGVVYCFAQDVDGKLIVGGDFTSYNNSPVNRLVRLNTDGTIDPTFNIGNGFDNIIRCVFILPNGSIAIGGDFTNYNSTPKEKFIVLLPDGSEDGTFDQGTGIVGTDVNDIKRQDDGKLLIAGGFYSYNAALIHGVFRINTDGSLDQTFNPGSGPGPGNASVNSIEIQSGGAVICVGGFSTFNGYQREKVVRLTSSGALDLSVDLNFGSNDYVLDAAILYNGKVIIVGEFAEIEGNNQANIALLDENLSFDASFKAVVSNQSIRQITQLTDSSLLVCGDFNYVNQTYRSNIAILDSLGKAISGLNPGSGVNGNIHASARFYNGDIILGGSLYAYNNNDASALIKINAEGVVDSDFLINNGLNYFDVPATGVSSIVVQPDQKVVIAGQFLRYHNDTVYNICRINSSGIIDPTFDAGYGSNNFITGLAIDNQSNIIVVGAFTLFDNVPRNRIVRLLPNGLIDNSFIDLPYAIDYISSIEMQLDGKILISGAFNTPNGFRALLRLNSDGTLDSMFDCQIASINSFHLLESSDILISNQTNSLGYFKLDSNGAPVDTSEYLATVSSPDWVTNIIETPDNKIILTGGFEALIDGFFTKGILRYLPTGELDTTFETASAVFSSVGGAGYINDIIFLNDSSMFAVGNFKKYNNRFYNSIVRLKNDSNPNDNLAIAFLNNHDIECGSWGQSQATGYSGYLPYSYTWYADSTVSDSIAYFDSPGVYTCVVTDGQLNVATASILISGPSSLAGNDLKATFIANSFRPGFEATTWINAFNDGCLPVSGQLKLAYDPLLDFVSSTPAPTAQSGDTLIWDFTDITYDSAHLTPQIVFNTSTLAVIGDTIHFTTIMTPIAGDVDTTNNVKYYSSPVVNGYDPNIKSVYPVGKCDVGYIKQDQLLTYTVQFQNTGNSEAINIAVIDSLDTDLDLNTIRVVGISHPMWTEVLPGNVLKFHFDNINLPDSTTNESESHGYVIFEVKPVSTWLNQNTEIANLADIYFDFNPPIRTNEVSNLIFQNDLDNYNCLGAGIEETSVAELIVFPNPANNLITIRTNQEFMDETILITDLQGKIVLSKEHINGSETTIDLSGLTNGIYLILTQTNPVLSRLVKQ